MEVKTGFLKNQINYGANYVLKPVDMVYLLFLFPATKVHHLGIQEAKMRRFLTIIALILITIIACAFNITLAVVLWHFVIKWW